jgi:hypothetical protein
MLDIDGQVASAEQDDSDEESVDSFAGAQRKRFDERLEEAKSRADFLALLKDSKDDDRQADIKNRMEQVPQAVNEEYLLWAVMLHPKFRQGIVNIVEGRLREEYKMILPLAVQQGIWDSVWRVATKTLGDLLSQNSISPNHVALAAAKPPADPEVQRNILTTILNILFDVAPDGYYYPLEGQAPSPQHSFWKSDWLKKLGNIGISVAKNTMKELSGSD